MKEHRIQKRGAVTELMPEPTVTKPSHDLGNNFCIGQWFPAHLELYYQQTIGVVMHFLSSSFASKSKIASYGKSGIRVI